MALTRREACSFIPALVAAGAGISALAAQDDSLPSATFPFENMPVQNSDHAQIRKIIKGRLATGEHIEAHETTLPPRWISTPAAPSRPLRDVAHPRRNRRAYDQWHERPSRRWWRRLRSLERRAWHQERRKRSGYLLCCRHRNGRGQLNDLESILYFPSGEH